MLIQRSFLSSAAQVGIVLLTVLDLALRRPATLWAATAVCAVFILLELERASRGLRRSCAVLLAVTFALLPLVSGPVATLERGLRIGCMIGALVLSVSLLARSAQRLPLLRDTIRQLVEVPPRLRFGMLVVCSQFFAGALGLAGIAMMMEVLSRSSLETRQDKLSAYGAVACGYVGASVWSPMFGNMSILLSVSPGLTWARVFPLAMGLTLLSLLVGLAVDQARFALRSGRAGPDVVAPAPALRLAPNFWPTLARTAWPVALAMLVFLGCVLVLSAAAHLPVAAIIMMAAPLAAWGLNVLTSEGAGRALPAAARVREDFLGLRSMVAEVMLFVVSGCAGTVIAAAIPVAWAQAISALVAPYPVLACLFAGAAVIALSCTSVHPILSSIVVASAFPAATLGLAPAAHMLSVLSGMGLAMIMTPFSVISLMTSRLSGLPLLMVSVRAHMAYVFATMVVVSLALGFASGRLTSL